LVACMVEPSASGLNSTSSSGSHPRSSAPSIARTASCASGVLANSREKRADLWILRGRMSTSDALRGGANERPLLVIELDRTLGQQNRLVGDVFAERGDSPANELVRLVTDRAAILVAQPLDHV